MILPVCHDLKKKNPAYTGAFNHNALCLVMFGAVFGCFDDARPADDDHGRDENGDGPSHDDRLDERWPLPSDAWQHAHDVLRLSGGGPRACDHP